MRTTPTRTARISAGAAALAVVATVLGGTGVAFAQDVAPPADPDAILPVLDYGQVITDTLHGAVGGCLGGLATGKGCDAGAVGGAVTGGYKSAVDPANTTYVVPPQVPVENSPTPPGGVTPSVIDGALNPQ